MDMSVNPVFGFLTLLAVFALVIWAVVKSIRLGRKGGEIGWQQDGAKPERDSLYNRWTKFLTFPFS